ncbi:MAG: DUF169 domain-containing protein [Patescibacteria group bacterium]
MTKEKLKQFKKALKINKPILGIGFSKKLPNNYQHYKDTACTALARAFSKKETLVFGAKKFPQLCSGGDYFLKLSSINDYEAMDVYVNDEHVFKDRKICKEFTESLPKLPNNLKNKFITIKPFQINDQPEIIIILANPAQVGRIIGLLNYEKYNEIKIYPNQPTCLSFFAPLVTKLPHLNFIDYYDRYYQGYVNNKYIWKENEMIISLTFEQFKEMLNNLNKSPQGIYNRVNIKTQKVSII